MSETATSYDAAEVSAALNALHENVSLYAYEGILQPYEFAKVAAWHATGRLYHHRRGVPHGAGSAFRLAVDITLECYHSTQQVKRSVTWLIDHLIAAEVRIQDAAKQTQPD